MFSLLLLSQHKRKPPQYPKHYDFHHNNHKQGLKASQLQIKEEKIGWNEWGERFQLNAANVELKFLGNIYVGHEQDSIGYFE